MSKKVISMILLAAMLTAVSCSGDTKQPDDTSAVDSTDDTAPVEDTDEGGRNSVKSSLPDDLDFGGASLTLLSRSEEQYLEEFDVEANGEVVNDAIFNRNQYVEEKLNIDFNVISREGVWGKHGEFMNSVKADVMSDSKEYDVISFYAYCNPTLAAQGLLMNLYDIKYIDFEKPWYHQMYIESATVYDKLYAITGDINLTSVSMLDAVYFNKAKLKDYYPDLNIYDKVKNGEWTMDYALSLTKDIYQDLDGDGKESDDDFYGFDMNCALDLWAVGLGIRYTQRSSDGGFEYDFYNERNTKIIDGFYDIYTGNQGIYFIDKFNDNRFINSLSLFTTKQLTYTNMLRDMKDDFGILPMFKLDEDQDRYYTSISDNSSQILIPTTCKDPDMVGAFIELMSEQSYKTVTPAWYETAMKGKYLRDDESSQMFDIIVESAWYDFAVINTSALGDPVFVTRGAEQRREGNFASYWAKQESALKSKLETLLDTYKNS